MYSMDVSPDVWLYSALEGREKKLAVRYLSKILGHPDEGSEFAQNLGNLKYVFRMPGINHIFAENLIDHLHKTSYYDALMLNLQNEIIGHTGFQIHDDNKLYVFSTGIVDEHRGNDLGLFLRKAVIDFAREKSISDVNLGKGGNPWTTHAYEKVIERSEEWGIKPAGDYWIKVNPDHI